MKFSLAMLTVVAGSDDGSAGDANGLCFSKHHTAVFPCVGGLACCGAGSANPSCYSPKYSDCTVCGDVALVCAKGQICSKVGASAACVWPPPSPAPTPPSPVPAPTPMPPAPSPAPMPASDDGIPLLHVADAAFKAPMIEVLIGGQPVTLMLDTGSTTLAVTSLATPDALPQCKGKEDYLSSNCVVGSYDPSKTGSDFPAEDCKTPETIDGVVRCGASGKYGDQSGWNGYIVEDELKIGKYKANVSLVSITELIDSPDGKGHFQEGPAAGIIGATGEHPFPDGFSGNCRSSVHNPDKQTCRPDAFNTILKTNGLDNVYGMCLGGTPTSANTTSDHKNIQPGLLTLGKSDSSLYTGEMLYAPSATSDEDTDFQGLYFTIKAEGWGVGGSLISTPSLEMQGRDAPIWYTFPATVDTGSSYVGVPASVYPKLANSGLACTTDDDCMFTMQVGGEEQSMCLEIKNPDLFSCQAGTCTAGHSLSPQDVDPDDPIATQTTMLGYPGLSYGYVEFDRARDRVGFAQRSDKPCKAECSAYFSNETCQMAHGCAWTSEKVCSGTATDGNILSGSKVTAGPCKSTLEIAV